MLFQENKPISLKTGLSNRVSKMGKKDHCVNWNSGNSAKKRKVTDCYLFSVTFYHQKPFFPVVRMCVPKMAKNGLNSPFICFSRVRERQNTEGNQW